MKSGSQPCDLIDHKRMKTVLSALKPLQNGCARNYRFLSAVDVSETAVRAS